MLNSQPMQQCHLTCRASHGPENWATEKWWQLTPASLLSNLLTQGEPCGVHRLSMWVQLGQHEAELVGLKPACTVARTTYLASMAKRLTTTALGVHKLFDIFQYPFYYCKNPGCFFEKWVLFVLFCSSWTSPDLICSEEIASWSVVTSANSLSALD